MPRVLLVAATTGYQTRSFTEAAHRLGIEVLLATDRCHVLEDPWRDNAIPVRFEEPEAAAELLARSSVDGVVAVADRPTVVAALTAKRLGLPYHPPLAVAACRDKHRMREVFSGAGLPAPEYFRVALDRDPREIAGRAHFPCVLKPLGLSASRGVIRANNGDEFVAAFERIRRILQQPEIRQFHEAWNEAIQIEQYIEGREFALEGLMTRGELEVLAIFDKPDPLEGPFFEETIYVRPSRDSREVQSAIVDATRRAVRALELYHGPIHAEMRVNDRGVFMLEVAARPIGGLCARALRFTAGLTLEEVVILHATENMPHDLTLFPPASGVMMIPVPRAGVFEAVTGIEEALRTPGVDDIVITAKIGQKLLPLPEGASYTGFIFAGGDDAAFVENALRTAHSKLKFDLFAALPVMSDVISVSEEDLQR
jgi:biotin carboxylase